jgi:hypothetical protein
MSNTDSESIEPGPRVDLEAVRYLLTRADQAQQELDSVLRSIERLLGGPTSSEARTRLRSSQATQPRWRPLLIEGESILPWLVQFSRGRQILADANPSLEFAGQSPEPLSEQDKTLLLRWCDGQRLEADERSRVHELLRSHTAARGLCDAALTKVATDQPRGISPATRAFEAAFFEPLSEVSSPDASESAPAGTKGIDNAGIDSTRVLHEAMAVSAAQARPAEPSRPTRGSGAVEAPDNQSIAAELRDRLFTSAESGRKPVLVIGSGALHQSGYGRLADWTALLKEVAALHDLPFDGSFASEQPTMFWESMLVFGAKRDQLQANQMEARLLRTVGDLLQTQDGRCDYNSFRHLQESSFFQSIVALNFTVAPILNLASGGVRASLGPFPSFEGPNCRVWCPHGHFSVVASMRLGARRYNSLTYNLEDSRAQYHRARAGRSTLSRAGEFEPDIHFVADVLESPLVFAGCGLRSAEWTVWWLIATKARNEARHPTCPSVFVTADPLPAAQHAALESMNCRVLKTRDYAEVWAFVDEIASYKLRRAH